jgi:peptidoglycan DL-endopeptidase CwlO
MWTRRTLVTGTLLGAASLGLPSGQAFADPAGTEADLVALLTRLRVLYLQAEEASEAYNAAKDRLRSQRVKSNELAQQLADQRAALTAAQDRVGQLAREQYKDGGVSPYADLVLSNDPGELFSRTRYLQRAAGSQAALITELHQGEERISALSAEAKDAVRQAKKLERSQRKAKEKTEERLAEAERILSGLTGAQRAELERLERLSVDEAQKQLIASGRLGRPGSATLTPSTAGFQAVQYAYRQLGKPYVWGAQGPDSFDCSGLTSQAWASGGVVIPRVSQQQWRQLTRVPLDVLRPGDLIIYFRGATHVAIYVGDGLVIQAPRPGAHVKLSPIASNSPILGAVRPDPGDGPMAGSYERPAADGGEDEGGEDDGGESVSATE